MGWGEKALFVVLPGRGPKEGASAHLKAAAETDCAPGTGHAKPSGLDSQGFLQG